MKILQEIEDRLGTYIRSQLARIGQEIEHVEDDYRILMGTEHPSVTVAQLRQILPPEIVISIETHGGRTIRTEENRIMKNLYNDHEIAELLILDKNVVQIKIKANHP